MSTNNRPLSPHLQVYKLPLSAMISIVHRATGAFLAMGTALLVWWLMAIADGEVAFLAAQSVMGGFFGRLFLFGWTFSLFFHLSNGIRHLIWDAGYGFEKHEVAQSSIIVIGTAGFLTFMIWVMAFAFGIGA